MLGAICGDIIGSIYERNNIKTKIFELFSNRSKFTDDSVLTIAIADSIVNKKYFAPTIHRYSINYPDVGYGSRFKKWSKSKHPNPYYSYGNGSAMRVSPVGFAYNTLDEVLNISKKTSVITHNHIDAIIGAQAIASAIFLAKQGKDKLEIKNYIKNSLSYNLEEKVDSIRKYYKFDVSAKGSVPQAIITFLESNDYEDAIRNAISIGGDSDTIACMCGSIAEAYYKNIPEEIIIQALKKLPKEFIEVIYKFYLKFIKNDKIISILKTYIS